ncbi:hypothetical protein L6452_01084 [Arctium lappa]|uniref:Uncharacterized protein n=1 Tax=Arctium lappa TaxID=4217 RepID=A0ACB9FFP6_ARCLA|nr:hypothetical protein L6452_01084 [Arctium lappa]
MVPEALGNGGDIGVRQQWLGVDVGTDSDIDCGDARVGTRVLRNQHFTPTQSRFSDSSSDNAIPDLVIERRKSELKAKDE